MGIRFFGMILIIALIVSPSLAAGVAPIGGVVGNGTFNTSGVDITVYANIPTTTEDVAYPASLFYAIAAIGALMSLLAIWFISHHDNVPSIAILCCGAIIFATFLIDAFMAPYVASTVVAQQVCVDTMYVTTINTYLFSPWVSYMCWGMATFGLLVTIAGALSFLGWFQRKGMKNAKKGKYLETDFDDDEPGLDTYRRMKV